jgi:hypothetical protein
VGRRQPGRLAALGRRGERLIDRRHGSERGGRTGRSVRSERTR